MADIIVNQTVQSFDIKVKYSGFSFTVKRTIFVNQGTTTATLQQVTENGATTDQDTAFQNVLDARVLLHNGEATSVYRGLWNAATNTPALDNTDVDVKGYYYKVSEAGTVDFGDGDITFGVDDYVAFEIDKWRKFIDNNQSGGGVVQSITGDLVDNTDPTTPIVLNAYRGKYNADTNTPTLANTDTGQIGRFYKVSEAGTQDFGAGNITFGVGDFIYNDGTVWEKFVDNNQNTGSTTVELRASNTIEFDTQAEYYTPTTATTGNITFDFTNAKKGIIQKLYHEDSNTFTLPAEAVLLNGFYQLNELNILYFEYVDNNRVEYWVEQEGNVLEQSDWSVTDPNSPDFIKNKPTITEIDQDNIYKIISTTSNTTGTSAFATALNNLPQWTIGEREIALVSIFAPDEVNQNFFTLYDVALIGVGKGTYGTGGTELLSSNIWIRARRPFVYDVDSPSNQLIELGDVGSTDIVTAFNNHTFTGSETPVQEQGEGYVRVTVTIDGDPLEYLFIGEGGTYGVGGDLTAVLADFILITGSEADGVLTITGDLVDNTTPTTPVVLNAFRGSYNANSNTPTLANTDTGQIGRYYEVSEAGTQDFGAGNITFGVGDFVYNDGAVWKKFIDNNQSGGGDSKVTNFYLSGVDTADTIMNNSSPGEKLTSVLVPANTFQVGDIIEVICRCVKVGVGNSAVVLLSVDTTDESSSNFMGQWGGGATNLTYYQSRRTWIIKTNDTEYLAAQTNLEDTNNFIANRIIDWTIDQYIIIAAKSASTTDTMRVSYLEINIKRP